MGLAGISSLLSNWSAAAHGNRLVAKTSAGRFRVGYIGSKFIKVKRKYNIIEGKYKKKCISSVRIISTSFSWLASLGGFIFPHIFSVIGHLNARIERFGVGLASRDVCEMHGR